MGDFFQKIWRTVISSLTSEIHLSSNYSEAYVKLFWKPQCTFVLTGKFFGM